MADERSLEEKSNIADPPPIEGVRRSFVEARRGCAFM
jgi:hypothetical protein